MPAIAAAHHKISPDDYLARELDSVTKSEYVDGIVYGMSGASDRHGLVSGTFFLRLGNHLADECQVFMTDMKLRIVEGDVTVFYYPDVIVSCAADDRARYYREQPILLVEVLSPSTERIDRTEKLAAYRRIPSLMELVLAEQDIPKLEVFRRATGWASETYLPGDGFRLESVSLDFTVDDIYRRLKFGEPPLR
jgi:Uma2 family endonuclease